MPEPTSSAVAGASAFAVGTITITGSFLGLQYDLLLVGLAGGLVALSCMRQVSAVRMLVSVFTSALVGGYGGPIAQAAAAEYLSWTAKYPDQMRWFCAFAVGFASHTFLPLALEMMRNRFGGGKPGAEASQ